MLRLALIFLSLTISGVHKAAGQQAEETGKSRALIVVGLPGDAEHRILFADTARQWRDWLTKDLDFEVTILFGASGQADLTEVPATRVAIDRAVADLKKAGRAEDRLWVFFLGHGDFDGERASFHLPGRDLLAEDMGKLFTGIKCKEQVFWMTNSSSGLFLKSLSAKGRIVITATAADDENNETELPHALATVVKKLDAKKDDKVSVLDLYRQTAAEVETSFAADKRAPTEHARLDDTGDGMGAEQPVVEKDGDKKPTTNGQLAARTFLIFRQPKK